MHRHLLGYSEVEKRAVAKKSRRCEIRIILSVTVVFVAIAIISELVVADILIYRII